MSSNSKRHLSANSNLEEPIYGEIRKILPTLKCAFHEDENLTNFCLSSKCLLPLCPSCVKIHTQQHLNMPRNDSHPQYESLLQTMCNAKNVIKSNVCRFEENHRQLVEIESKVEEFKQQIVANLGKVQTEILNYVKNYFSQMESQILNKISQVPYIQRISQYKSEVKSTLLNLEKLNQTLIHQSISTKPLMRNLIKFYSSDIDQKLFDFDQECKATIDSMEGSFCQIQVKERKFVEDELKNFLLQVSKVEINPKYANTKLENCDSMSSASKALKQIVNISSNRGKKAKILGQKSSETTLTNILNKVIEEKPTKISIPVGIVSSASKKKKAESLSFSAEKQKQNQNPLSSAYSSIVQNIFSSSYASNKKNHQKSQSRNNTHLTSNSFCQSKDQSRRRSSNSRGKGLSLIQPSESRSFRKNVSEFEMSTANGARFSLSNIENINFDFAAGNNTCSTNQLSAFTSAFDSKNCKGKAAYIHRRN